MRTKRHRLLSDAVLVFRSRHSQRAGIFENHGRDHGFGTKQKCTNVILAGDQDYSLSEKIFQSETAAGCIRL
jgi:hypothetical protein